DYPEPELEEQLRSVSSVDELMKIVYPKYWNMLRCQSKSGGHLHFREKAFSDTRTEDPLVFAAAFYNLDILKSIDTEWRKTQCMPREVCLDVGKEFGAATNTFFKPPCVSVYRCGGCCNNEGLQCMNISTSYISKTLFEITVPLSQGPKPVTVSFANHTSCRCLSKLDVYRHVHSIIRRSLPDGRKTRLICTVLFLLPDAFDGVNDICGPNKELDDETCQCVCKGTLIPSSCGPNRVMDRDSCQCVCKLLPTSCGPNTVFDKDSCQCACSKVCPRHQPLNPDKCTCECTESPNRCFLRGRRFQHQTCSCYSPPCEGRRKRCEARFYFSEEVCRCVPTFWRRPAYTD
ncbi:UNVERIFIED_CONTAM: hypothetical protein FKN15_076500, partial [Acipenser sinensis]